MLLTRGEAVQRNTSAEGVPVVRKQIQDLKDSWDALLSASIQCKRSEKVTDGNRIHPSISGPCPFGPVMDHSWV